MPLLPPASMAMLQRVSRASTLRPRTASPVNSMARYVAPSTPMVPMTWRIMSLAETHGLGMPWKRKRMVSGTLNHVVPVMRAAARSVEPTPVLKQPSPPYVQEWESAPSTMSPGRASPSWGSRMCSMPPRPSS